jgi:hypothetical protein
MFLTGRSFIMTSRRFIPLLLLLIFAAAIPAAAQRPRKPAPKPKFNADVASAKQKTENQLSNVNRFIEVLGPIAQNIEELDRQNRIKPLPKDVYAKNEANKKKVVAALRNLRAGLVSLETDFRTKAALKKFLPSIQGISDLAAESEDDMLASKFVSAKDPLRSVAQKLADTYALIK